MKNLKIFFLLLFFLPALNSFAAKRYWVAAHDSIWNSTVNWSTSSGGAGGASVPGSSDTAYFDGGSVKNDTFDINVSVKRLDVASGYTGIIVQGGNTLTIGTGEASLAGGTFSGGSASITLNGATTISGTAFTSTSGTMTVAANFTISSGSFTHNNGKISFTKTLTFTVSNTGGTTFYDMDFNPTSSSTFTITNTTTITVSHTLTYSGTQTITLSSGTIDAQGDIRLSGTGASGGGTATILIDGSGDQSFVGVSASGSRMPNVTINKSGGTLSLSNNILVGGDWTYTAGTVNPGTSTVGFIGTKTISGTLTLFSLGFNGASASTYTISTGTTLSVTGTLTLTGTQAITLSTGTLDAQGNITIMNTSSGTGGNGALTITGSANQTWTGSGTAGAGKLPNVTINKSGGTLTLSSIISVTGDFTYTGGTVDATTNTSTVDFYGNLNLDGKGSSTLPFYNVTTAGGTVTLTDDLAMNNNLTINSSTTLSAGSNAIAIGGNWSDNGTWTYGTSSVTFNGSGYNNISKSSGTETFYNLGFNRTANSQTLLNPLKVNNALTLTKGHVKTTNTNILELIDNATLSGGGIGAYVCGPVRKTGNDAFTFPLGDTTLTDSAAYHPLYMTAPSSTTDQFDATYFPSLQTYGDTTVDSISSVSSCEYWTLKRVTGTSTPTVSLTWNSNCDNSGYNEMRVGLWNGTVWNDLGQASVTISSPKSGTVTASSATSFTANPAPLTIAYRDSKKSYSILAKTVDGGFFTTDGYELYFAFAEEYKDSDGLLSFSITRLSDDQKINLLNNANNNPAVSYGNNHYRIDLYDTSNTPLSHGYYMLQVTNEKNESWYLRFKI